MRQKGSCFFCSARFFLPSLLLMAFACALPVAPTRAADAPPSLAKKITKIIASPALKNTLWGIEIRKSADPKVLFCLNAEKNFVPASNLKLLTAAAVLDQAGPDFRFKTLVFGESQPGETEPLLDGEWRGNLVLKGGGDPVFSNRLFNPEEEHYHPEEKPAALRDLARQLAARGIHKVTGRVVVDNTGFLSEPIGKGWEWDDLAWYYAAPVTPLAVNENSIEVCITPGAAEGDPCQFSFTPSLSRPFFQYRVQTTLKEPLSPLGIERWPDRDGWILAGEVQAGGGVNYERVAAWNPGEYAGNLFRAALAEEGISISGGTEVRAFPAGVEPEKAEATRPESRMPTLLEQTELAIWPSPPLNAVLQFLLKDSNNLYAEMLLRHLGKTVYPVGSVKGGLTAVRRFLAKARIGSDAGVVVQDGSGLSKSNLVSPHALVQLLVFMKNHCHSRAFFEGLPVAGVDGTLKSRMVKSVAKGRIFAKTGTLSTANSLSGYAKTLHGEEMIFSILANNHAGKASEVRKAIDQICEAMVECADPLGKEPATKRKTTE